MIELGIIDLSAEGRRRIASLIEKWSWASPDSQPPPPQCSVTLLSPEEVRFNAACDVYLVGPELVRCDVAFLATLRRQLPQKLVVCVLDSRTYSLSIVEQLGRVGVDDVLIESATSDEFFRRLVLLQRRIESKRRGALSVVSGARGGVGVTFVAAAFAEALTARGRTVCLVDCDVVSQDLTRSLRVAPHVSESLLLLLEQQRILTSEGIQQCAIRVWGDDSRLLCVPPPTGGDQGIFCATKAARAFVHFLDGLRSHYDEIIVDTASLPVSCVQALHQNAERALFVANRDPSGAFANRRALSLISGYLQPEATLSIILNDNSIAAASITTLCQDVLVAPGHSAPVMRVPRMTQAATWACTGATPYRFSTRVFERLVSRVVEEERRDLRRFEGLTEWVCRLARRLQTLRPRILRGRKWAKGNTLEDSSSTVSDARYLAIPETDSVGGQDGRLVSRPMLIS